MPLTMPRALLPRWIVVLVGLSLLGNVFAWLSIGLLPDEAYYWVWSKRLELGYYDHPPLIAWLMAGFTGLFGNGLWALRLPAVVSWLVGASLSYHMAQRMFGGQAGALAILVWATLPIMQVGFHIATPDSALILFAWLTVWFAYRAIEEARPTLWLAAGLMGGLTMLGKYPGIFVVAAVFLALLSTRRGRTELTTRWPWLAVLVALLTVSPMIFWNWQHEWVSFAFQFGHGVQKTVKAPFNMFLLFLGGQFFAVMPWTFIAMAWSAASAWRTRLLTSAYAHALLVWGFALPLLMFGLAGLTSKSGPNWPETAYVTGTLLLAGVLNRLLYRANAWNWRRVSVVIALGLFAILLVNLLRFPFWIGYMAERGLTQKRTQLSQSYGWDKVRPVLDTMRHEWAEDGTILVDNHARAGMIAWLLNAPEQVTSSRASRVSQYTLWQDAAAETGRYCLYVQQFDSEVMDKAAIPLRKSLPEGNFELRELVTLDNPDHSLRWLGFYQPLN